MKIKRLVSVISVFSVLAGCGMFGDEGTFRNRSTDYRSAEEIPPIVVPAGLDDDPVGQLYVIPPIPETNVLEEFDGVPRPQALSVNNLSEVIKIQRLGEDRWILSNRSPSEIWPRVRNILNRSGIPTGKAEAGEGILETSWLEFKGDDAFNHRYRFMVQPGVQLNSTEIRVLHDRVTKEQVSKDAWPDDSVDDAREQDMVEILSNALAGDATSGTVSLLAQSIGGEERVEFITPALADPYLLVKLDFERAWASLAYSLNKGGFTTIDQDQTDGVFYVAYYPEQAEEEDGWFSGWFGGREEQKLEANYQIKLNDAGDGIQVRVLDKEGLGLDRQEAIRLLKSVRANLS